MEFLDADQANAGLSATSDLSSIQFLPARLLVVDDVAANRELIKGYLRPFELTLDMASGGREAISMAAADPPAVILMDLKMPDMNGLEAVREIKATEGLKSVPVIAVSASVIGKAAEEAMKYMDGFVPKPVSRGSLVAELMKFLPQRFVWATEGAAAGEVAAAPPDFIAGDLSEEERSRLGELVGLLEVEQSRWSTLSERLTINEIEEFGEYVRSLGERFECVPVEEWGAKLAETARVFDLDAMGETLQRFPELAPIIASALG